jgi:hypothetical protein
MPGPEQLGQASAPVGHGGMGPDQHTGNRGAAVGGVAPGLEHDVISTGPGGRHVSLAQGRQPVSSGPGPWRPLLVEHHHAHLRATPWHQAIERVECLRPATWCAEYCRPGQVLGLLQRGVQISR